jgi:hypothetical protein
MISSDKRRRRATQQRPGIGSPGAKPAAGTFPGGAAAFIEEVDRFREEVT